MNAQKATLTPAENIINPEKLNESHLCTSQYIVMQ